MAVFIGQCGMLGGRVPGDALLSQVGLLITILLLVYLDSVSGTQHVVLHNNKTCSSKAEQCKNGLVVPIWLPQDGLSIGETIGRAIIYMLSMIYLFMGVSIVADRFMAGIEVITSQEREKSIKLPNGEIMKVNVRIWNETVSNLTLMALGSSAPEILLAIIEICGNKFNAGDLGPSTIVGSAAFNLFIIIAICVMAVPNGEVRRIRHLRVFMVTAAWSVFAYIWLYLILSVFSKGIVEVWEGLLTFAFFPGTVVTAYIADRKLISRCLLPKKYQSYYRTSIRSSISEPPEKEVKEGPQSELNEGDTEDKDPNVREYIQHRQEFIDILRDLKHKYPNADRRTLEEMAELEAVHRWPKSRAYYRIEATRRLTGAGKMIKKAKIEKRGSLEEVNVDGKVDDGITCISFDLGRYTVMENVGNFPITISRAGGDLKLTVLVDFFTQDGTATAGSDYEPVEGTMVFHPGQKERQFSISVIDDDIFEEDEHFYVHLTNIRIEKMVDGKPTIITDPTLAKLEAPYVCTVTILDDDHPGIFHFENNELSVTENIGQLQIKVVRSSGARGCVAVPFHAVDDTAKAGVDFDVISGELYFENDESEQFIKIQIKDEEEYERTECFYVELGEPYIINTGNIRHPPKPSTRILTPEDEKRIAEMGKPKLGEVKKIAIYIRESEEFKSVVDKMLKKANLTLVVGTSSWREQFIDALTVNAGDEEDDDAEETEEKLPTVMDYVLHFLTLFWKILFATIPPTDFWSGWACFVTSIIMIGLLTAVIGDIAASFGCTIGLKDAVTAISFVALGTSVPDTFASKVSAINDKYADSSIGNVTGSNAVNVFLGIGIAWSLAAIYHAINGNDFDVNPGTLALSVTVFCIEAFFAICLMMYRRQPHIGGELGGPRFQKVLTALIMVSFWLLYLIISSLVPYCYIEGF